MRSVPSTTDRLSGEASTSIGKHFAGRRLAYRSSSLRRARSPRSGRRSCATVSHLGPPTAPKRIAWDRRHRSSVPGASGCPVASIAAPPTSACSNSNPTPAPLPTALDRKSTRLNSSHGYISYAVFCLKKKKHQDQHATVPYLVSPYLPSARLRLDARQPHARRHSSAPDLPRVVHTFRKQRTSAPLKSS